MELAKFIFVICLICYGLSKIPTTDKQDNEDYKEDNNLSVSEEMEVILMKILKEKPLNEQEINIAEDLFEEIIEKHMRYSDD